jgi:hypothetical protein
MTSSDAAKAFKLAALQKILDPEPERNVKFSKEPLDWSCYYSRLNRTHFFVPSSS